MEEEFSNSLAAGIDGIPSILMKKCADSLSGPLSTILKQSYDLGYMPGILKLQLILPQHKSGALKSKPSSFRPISLTSQISKLMEKILKNNIISHLENNNLLGKFQFGFRSGRSCLASLLGYYEKILECVEDGGNIDSLFLDFEKAFDKVDHGLLCHRLREKGIMYNTGTWIHNFLSNRFQYVLANGKLSDKQPITSGVPQGSVLGPILFLLIIDTIGEIDENITIACFADDSKLFYQINNIDDAAYFQECIEKLDTWQKMNNMSFNAGKFQLIHYGRDTELRKEYNYMSPDYSSIISPSTVVRDL